MGYELGTEWVESGSEIMSLHLRTATAQIVMVFISLMCLVFWEKPSGSLSTGALIIEQGLGFRTLNPKAVTLNPKS